MRRDDAIIDDARHDARDALMPMFIELLLRRCRLLLRS